MEHIGNTSQPPLFLPNFPVRNRTHGNLQFHQLRVTSKSRLGLRIGEEIRLPDGSLHNSKTRPTSGAMAGKNKWQQMQRVPAVRTALFLSGLFLMAASPAVGALPGPGGMFVFAGGLALSLKYSEWAKRRYVRFKRRHPRKGEWTDWGMRRASAKRRRERRKAAIAAEKQGLDD